jgi:hypothetical protein
VGPRPSGFLTITNRALTAREIYLIPEECLNSFGNLRCFTCNMPCLAPAICKISRMRQHAREWVVFLITILVAVPGLPYIAGLVGLWIAFFRPPYELSWSIAWEAAFDVPRAHKYFYGIRLIWPIVPVWLFLTGMILLYCTIYIDTVHRKVRRRAVALMVVGWTVWWVRWSFTAITVIVFLAVIATLVYSFWSATRGPRQDDEDAGTPLPNGVLTGLGALFVAFFAYAVLHDAPRTDVQLDYLVNEKELKVLGRVTVLSEDRWHYIACKGDAYRSKSERSFYRRRLLTITEYRKKFSMEVYQPPESFPLSIFTALFTAHIPEHYVNLCPLRGEQVLILLGKRQPPAPYTNPYSSPHFN